MSFFSFIVELKMVGHNKKSLFCNIKTESFIRSPDIISLAETKQQQEEEQQV